MSDSDFYTEYFDWGGGGGGVGHSKGGGVSLYTPPPWGYLVMGGVVVQMGGGGMRGYRVFLGVIGNPPPTAVCNFFLLVDLPRTLQQFGSAPEIPVRTPPPF